MSSDFVTSDGGPQRAQVPADVLHRDRDEQGTSSQQWAQLLRALGPTAHISAVKYRQLHAKLCGLFERRGFAQPEDLADLAMNRAARSLSGGAAFDQTDVHRLVTGIAYKVFRELVHERGRAAEVAYLDLEFYAAERGMRERYQRALSLCLQGFEDGGALVREYHRGDRSETHRHRQQLASRFGVGLSALRQRVSRQRAKLAQCIRLRLEAWDRDDMAVGDRPGEPEGAR